MKDEILSHLDNPAQLEKLYRRNKPAFKQAFNALQPELSGSVLAAYWRERLNYAGGIAWGTRTELMVVLIAALLAGLFAKVPQIFSIDEQFFYQRNVGFVIFPLLTAYFVWKTKSSVKGLVLIAGATLLALFFINVFPTGKRDTLLLSCIHLPIFLWFILGVAFTGVRPGDVLGRLKFLTYNGDLVVITAIMLLAGVLLSGITISLFSLIGLGIEKAYFEYVGIFGLAATPIIGTYLVQANPQLVGTVSPVIAKIFSPLVLVMLVAYLAAICFSGRDPYNDRDFLLVFNALLIGVMAIIYFSIAEMDATVFGGIEVWILLLLAGLTLLVNGIALSAILFRISEWGITPNRAAVLGSNGLMLVNLLLVTVQLFRAVKDGANRAAVGNSMAMYLPIYGIWALIVTFVFPLLFDFR